MPFSLGHISHISAKHLAINSLQSQLPSIMSLPRPTLNSHIDIFPSIPSKITTHSQCIPSIFTLPAHLHENWQPCDLNVRIQFGASLLPNVLLIYAYVCDVFLFFCHFAIWCSGLGVILFVLSPDICLLPSWSQIQLCWKYNVVSGTCIDGWIVGWLDG